MSKELQNEEKGLKPDVFVPIDWSNQQKKSVIKNLFNKKEITEDVPHEEVKPKQLNEPS